MYCLKCGLHIKHAMLICVRQMAQLFHVSRVQNIRLGRMTILPRGLAVCIAAEHVLGFNTYVGCYRDSNTLRRLPFFLGDAPNIQTCQRSAVRNQSAYFGIQEGGQCWAGNDLSLATGLGSATCGMPCSADGTANCGGSLANAVYAVQGVSCSF